MFPCFVKFQLRLNKEQPFFPKTNRKLYSIWSMFIIIIIFFFFLFSILLLLFRVWNEISNEKLWISKRNIEKKEREKLNNKTWNWNEHEKSAIQSINIKSNSVSWTESFFPLFYSLDYLTLSWRNMKCCLVSFFHENLHLRVNFILNNFVTKKNEIKFQSCSSNKLIASLQMISKNVIASLDVSFLSND